MFTSTKPAAASFIATAATGAIVLSGGTGSYEGARGQATVAPQPGKGNPALVTISLLP